MAASRGAQSPGGPISTRGATTASAPSSSSKEAKEPACPAGRVMTMRLPSWVRFFTSGTLDLAQDVSSPGGEDAPGHFLPQGGGALWSFLPLGLGQALAVQAGHEGAPAGAAPAKLGEGGHRHLAPALEDGH